ncbi:hypothetical protein [Kitasatospora sp. NPDC094016]|uniref:hypothetical protein n=1 Tax=Kitasatospora sp. NPDC094016 TaxID=3154986 RepID=UPI00332028CE
MTGNDADAPAQRLAFSGHYSMVNRGTLEKVTAARLSASQLELFMGILAGAVDLRQGPLPPQVHRDLAKLQEHELIVRTAQGYEISPNVARSRPAS